MGEGQSGSSVCGSSVVAGLTAAVLALAVAAPAFGASGTFDRAWGKDVASAGPGNTGVGFEICVAGNGDTCQIGGTGGLGGEMSSPRGVRTDAAGNVYVAEQINHRIQKFDSSGNFLRAWGKDVIDPASPGDTGTGFEICVAGVNTCKAGTAGTLGGEMGSPFDVAADLAGNVYVADRDNHRIQKFDSSGNFLRAWGKDVAAAGPGDTGTDFEICVAGVDTCKAGSSATALGGEMSGPRGGVGTDSASSVYVADNGNHRIQKFDSSGNFLRAWGKDVINGGGTGFEICVAGVDTCQIGTAGGLGGEMNLPAGLATDSVGNVYLGDAFNHRIQRFDSSGNFLRAWGKDVASAGPGNTGTGFEICVAGVDTCQAGSNATALGGEMNFPAGVATDSVGNVYLADNANRRIQKFVDPAPLSGAGGGPPAPSNAFTIGKLKGKTLKLNVSSAGEVKITDAAAQASDSGASAAAKGLRLKRSSATGGPGSIAVKLKLTKAANRKLRERGKIKVNARITFTPSGGTANSQTAKLKVKK
jgi:hypothetical protein